MQLQQESNKTEQLNNNVKICVFLLQSGSNNIFLIFIPNSGKVPDI